jgi:dTDP-4-dehydrorhamnose reductase
MKIVVIGKSGQLAQELKQAAPEEILCLGREEINVFDRDTLFNQIKHLAPDAVINASAYTGVDLAEKEVDKAYALNAQAVENLGVVCFNLSIPLVHVSTDFVFDGSSNRPYDEFDVPNPIGAYGQSKYQGEQLLLAANPRSIIIRTSWVYGRFGSNFMKTMIRLGQERSEISVVSDQWGSPTASFDLAKGILKTIKHPSWIPGIYHFTNTGTTTWFDFAQKIMALTGSNTVIKPIETSEYPTPAKRPKYSKLNTSKWEQTYQSEIPQWEESLQQILQNDAV